MRIKPSIHLNEPQRPQALQTPPTSELIQYLEQVSEGIITQETTDIRTDEASALSILSFVDPMVFDESVRDDFILGNIGPSDAQAQIAELDPDKYVNGQDADFFFVNGIDTSEGAADLTALRLSTLIGKDVESVYSKALGVLEDVDLAHKMDVTNKSQANPLAKNSDLRFKLVDSLVNKGNNVKIIAHSRGSSEVASALWELRTGLSQILGTEKTNEYLGNVEIVTMGALAVPSDFPSDVKLTQISNPFDLVPKLSPSSMPGRVRLSQIEQIKDNPQAGEIIAETYHPKQSIRGYLDKGVALAKLGGLSLTLHVFQAQQHFVDSGGSSYLGQSGVQKFLSKLAD